MANYESKLPERVAAARAGAADQAYLTQSSCINWLLDCRCVCSVPSGRSVIDNALGEMGHLGVISGQYFRSVLDRLDLALAVESAFNATELKAA